LTGAFNRRACDDKLHEITRTTVSLGLQNFTLMMMDIDHFKGVNDTHGHQTGDEALKMVAEVVRRHLRASDFFARFGGEEFILALPDTPMDAALGLADRLRHRVSELAVEHEGKAIALTVSIGVAEWRDGEDSLEPAMDRGDKALYLAKENGRNRVETVEP